MSGAMKGLYAKRGWFYYQPPMRKGVRPPAVALETQDEFAAILKAKKLRDGDDLKAAKAKGAMSEVLPLYLRAKSDDSEATKRPRKYVLESFCEIAGDPKVAAISGEMVTAWREHLRTVGGTKSGTKRLKNGKLQKLKPCSSATMTSYLIVLKAFITWCREKGYLTGDPLLELKRKTQVNVTRVNEFLTVEERDRAFEALAKVPDLKGTRAGRRERLELVLLLGFYVGLRDGEMMAMNPKWVWISPDGSQGKISVQDTKFEYEDGSVGWWKPKGKRRREIPMHPKLLEYFKVHGVCSPWVLAPEKERWPARASQAKRFDMKTALANHAKRSGLKKLNFHILRHSFATHLAMAGVPLAVVAAFLGDRLSVAESNYAGFIPSKVNPLEVL